MREQHKQTELLQAFEIKRSSYQHYRQKGKKTTPERERLMGKVIRLHHASRGSAGSRSISALLKREGESVGRFKARSLMREADLTSKQPGAHRYKRALKPSDIADNHLSRQFSMERTNQVWCGDVTYVWAGERWLYLALVIDLYARRIVGWACSDSPDSKLTSKALRLAYEARDRPQRLLFHSDQGCHYTSKAFRMTLQERNIQQSMSRRGNCWDNAPMERCFRSFKTEWMPKYGYSSHEQAERDILQYIRYFNQDRVHTRNAYRTPIEAEKLAA